MVPKIMKKSRNRKRIHANRTLGRYYHYRNFSRYCYFVFRRDFRSCRSTCSRRLITSIYKGLVQKYKGQVKFPKGDTLDEESPAGFAIWFRNKTRNPEPGLWYIDEDDKALALVEDEDGPGIPSSIPTDIGDLDDDQKMPWLGQLQFQEKMLTQARTKPQERSIPDYVDPRS